MRAPVRQRVRSMSRFSLLCPLTALFGIAGCGGGAANVRISDPPVPPSWDALSTMPSVAGAWQVAVWTWPQPAIKGSDDVVFRITDANGLPADHLDLQVVPWMPAHAHGTTPTLVTSEGDGYYLVKPVYFYMSGEWQLRTTIGGSASDSVTPVVEVP